jgi:hypothetical protein
MALMNAPAVAAKELKDKRRVQAEAGKKSAV